MMQTDLFDDSQPLGVLGCMPRSPAVLVTIANGAGWQRNEVSTN